MNLEELSTLLQEKKQTIQEWYDSNISTLYSKRDTKEAEIDATYPGDEYSDIRAQKKEELSNDTKTKEDSLLTKMNSKIEAAEEYINTKIDKFNASVIAEEEALLESINTIKEEKIKKAAEYKIKMSS